MQRVVCGRAGGGAMTRKRHLTLGWCWRADLDGEPALFGIYGHFEHDAAIEIARGYEGDEILTATVSRDYRRTVPCRASTCDYECGGSHLERANGPGRGASPYTWVEVRNVADGDVARG